MNPPCDKAAFHGRGALRLPRAVRLGMRELFFDRGDMKRIERVNHVIPSNHNHDLFSDSNKFRMWNRELAPIRHVDRERFKSASDPLANAFYVLLKTISLCASTVNPFANRESSDD
jgi:hypothetical protein